MGAADARSTGAMWRLRALSIVLAPAMLVWLASGCGDDGAPPDDGGALEDRSADAGDGGADAGADTGTPGYEPRPVVPGDTTPESSGPQSLEADEPGELALSDGTTIVWPALGAEGAEPLTTITLERESTTLPASPRGYETTGSTRTVELEPFDPHGRGITAARLVPTLRIPEREVHGLDPDTLVVARIADVYRNGEPIDGDVVYLPAHVEEDGGLVVVDYLFPDSVESAWMERSGPIPRAGGAAPDGSFTPNRIQYVATTFQGHVNWAVAPALERMIPTLDGEQRANRVPIIAAATELVDREAERCVRNVVILVHGHNEEERTGDPGLESAPGPWGFAYKRDVWNHLYGAWLAADPSAARCTAFYELVYPTFRPIFSEPGGGRERLDESFARLLRGVLVDPGPGAMPDNVYVVAHSMGGLVARAGLQLVDPEIARRVRRVVTWGTPHLGSPLVSLRMALAANPPYRVLEAFVASHVQSLFGGLAAQAAADAGWRWMRDAVTALQVDSPGTRDLRWARLYPDDPHGLALDQVLETTEAQQAHTDIFGLGSGLELYSDNTTSLDVADALSPREVYSFFYGTTGKRVTSLTDATEIALGATVLEWIVARPADMTRGELNGSSDGAVSVASLMGEGLGAERVDLDDVDHEEYFGAPNAASPRPDLGLLTAETTLDRLRITTEQGRCPQVEARIDVPGVRPLRIDGRLVWPDEPSPGWRLSNDHVFVVGVGSTRPPLRLDAVETSADGTVHGTFDPPDLGAGVTTVRLRLVLVGGAVLESSDLPLAATPTTIDGHLDATGEAPVGLTNPARHYTVSGVWRVRGLHPEVEPLGSGGPFPYLSVGADVPVRIELEATMTYDEPDPPPAPATGCDTSCGASSGCVEATIYHPLELIVPAPRMSYPSVYELLAGSPAEMGMTVSTIPGGYAVELTPPAGAQVSAGIAFRLAQTKEHRCPDGRVARTTEWSQLVRTGAVVVRTP